eukprot:TRINITY_DN734_c0_g2_i1.p2 TRINITY_DN734_c0_g2~~TRINITY_DN734_c0_g2_i1.p2  ORF type:complete len:913 (+),score=101.33 TRINITY_DN734_c0_g2_i1:2321-5059(+)
MSRAIFLSFVCTSFLAALVQSRIQALRSNDTAETGSTLNHSLAFSHKKETAWKDPTKTTQTSDDSLSCAQREKHVSLRIAQLRSSSFASINPTPSLEPVPRELRQSSTSPFAGNMETNMPVASSTPVSSTIPLSAVSFMPSAPDGSLTQSAQSSSVSEVGTVRPSISDIASLMPSVSISSSPSASQNTDAIAPVASRPPQRTFSASPSDSVDIRPSTSSSSTPSASVSLSVSNLPITPAPTLQPRESGPGLSQTMRPSEKPSVLPEASHSTDDTGKIDNQSEHITIGETITVSDSSRGPLLNRTGERDNDAQFSEVLIILTMNNTRSGIMPTNVRQDTLNVSQSVAVVTACLESLVGNEESIPLLSLHAFDRPTLKETDVIASRGFRSSFQLNDTYACPMGLILEIPNDTLNSVYLVLSRRLPSGSVVVEISATQATTLVATSPLLWNRDLLSIPEKENIGLDTAEKAKVFVISSWPNLKHIELKDMQVDNAGLQHIYGSTSRFPNPICDDSGTQVMASIVGKQLGIGPRQATTIPIPVRDCETPYSVSGILSALSLVNSSVDNSPSSKWFIVFDDLLQESGFLNNSSLLQELKALANAGVITIVPGKVCHDVQPSYISVGAFGRRLRDDTNSSSVEEYVIRSSECANKFDVFGPGDFSTSTSIAGPESYENLSWGSNVAAGGMLGVFLLMCLDQNLNITVSEAKTVLKGLTKTNPIFGDLSTSIFNGSGPALPLLGAATSLSDLRKSIQELAVSNSTGGDFVVSKSSKLPVGAIIGICSVLFIVVILISAGLFVAWSRRTSDNDNGEPTLDEDIESAGIADHQGSQIQNDRALRRPPTITDIQSPIPIRPSSHMRDADKSRPPQPQPVRVPVVQRLLSLNRAKESPITKGDKASWFATPRSENHGNNTFNR